ncbi:unnamed protein product [Prorocentrum cordatum]|uniref:BolA-like protein n=1 Tax=Prorocentrum cordatum TaxID=2364126 RepID=A0ABN9TCS1_9DINO|nr:unnamed protein product [Polarella glacialis]
MAAAARETSPVRRHIEATLHTSPLAPFTHLEVQNESHGRHEDESHFHVVAVSAAFEGKPRLERHRSVQTLLSDAQGKLLFHALRLTAKTPAQWEAAPTAPPAPRCTGAGDGRGATDVARLPAPTAQPSAPGASGAAPREAPAQQEAQSVAAAGASERQRLLGGAPWQAWAPLAAVAAAAAALLAARGLAARRASAPP